MGDNSLVPWTDSTWNPIVGCSILSPACIHCYAMGASLRMEKAGIAHYAGLTQPGKTGPVWTGRIAMAPDAIFLRPLRWKRKRKIFVNSMGDLFHESVSNAMIDRVFAVIALCPQHIFQILTKRPKRMRDYFTITADQNYQDGICEAITDIAAYNTISDAGIEHYRALRDDHKGAWPIKNVWLGVTAEDQPRANDRIPELLATPASIHFVSVEPQLAALDLSPWLVEGWRKTLSTYRDTNGLSLADLDGLLAKGLDWVICGGETGANARPTHPLWPLALRDQCAAKGIPYYFKGWGEWAPHTPQPGGDLGRDLRRGYVRHLQMDREPDGHFRQGDRYVARVGKRHSGNLLNNLTYEEFPQC